MISVVVPVLDGLPHLEAQLGALLAQEVEGDWEVVVADDGSTDGSRELVAGWAARTPRLHLVAPDGGEPRGTGPAATRNRGVAAAVGDRLAFCDADDVVAPGWLAACAGALDGADVVAGRFDFRSLNGRPPAEPEAAATRQLGYLPAGLGANLALTRDAFEGAGGFDEALRIGEDIDLCWRLQESGRRFAVAPGAVVAKREAPGPGPVFRRAFAYGRADARLYRRHRAEGARRDGRGALRAWAWLVATAPALVRADHRTEWARGAGIRCGRLVGSAEQAVWFP